MTDVVVPLSGADDVGEFLLKLAAPLGLALFIHGCLFVGELAMLIGGPPRDARRVVDGFAHILTGPIAVISFYSNDSVGTLLFFGSLWHFLCDCAETRPTYVLLWPGRTGRTAVYHYLRWFESLWVLLHHIFIGTVKLGLDRGTFNETNDPLLLFVFIAGAGLAHLSFGMDAFHIRGGSSALVISQVMRASADVAIVAKTWGDEDDWQFLMLMDLIWLAVIFLVRTLERSFPAPAEPASSQMTDEPVKDKSEGSRSFRRTTSAFQYIDRHEADLALISILAYSPEAVMDNREKDLIAVNTFVRETPLSA